MKELKFRHYNLFTGEMLYSDKHFQNLEHYFSNPEYDSSEDMQFTGLKDINGVEIYEGDIVIVNESHKALKADFGENKRVVQWREGGACLDMLHADYLESKRKIGLMFDNGAVDSIQVIGNIYENHELLESK